MCIKTIPSIYQAGEMDLIQRIDSGITNMSKSVIAIAQKSKCPLTCPAHNNK